MKKKFPVRRGLLSTFSKKKLFVRAVDGIDFQIDRGEVLGLAGESGSGKTTTANLLALLEPPTEGGIILDGVDVTRLRGKKLNIFRKRVQIIFQDPYESLDPRFTVHDTVYEPLLVHKIGSSKNERTKMICDMLRRVGLKPPEDYLLRCSHELSGGERQRVAIARAMILNPQFIIADEPVSMLDTSIRAGVMNLIIDLVKELNATCLFISHDLSVTRYMSNRIAIIYLGKILELGPTEEVISNPRHPYTKTLLSCVPVPDPTYKRPLVETPGEIPSSIDIPRGCRFHPRCQYARDNCRNIEPEIQEIEMEHFVACHFAN